MARTYRRNRITGHFITENQAKNTDGCAPIPHKMTRRPRRSVLRRETIGIDRWREAALRA